MGTEIKYSYTQQSLDELILKGRSALIFAPKSHPEWSQVLPWLRTSALLGFFSKERKGRNQLSLQHIHKWAQLGDSPQSMLVPQLNKEQQEWRLLTKNNKNRIGTVFLQWAFYDCKELCQLWGSAWVQRSASKSYSVIKKGKINFPLFYQLPAMPADSVKTELRMSPSF